MEQKQRKMAFFELNSGKVAIDFQEQFERMQKEVEEAGAKGTVTFKINIYPSKADSNYGEIDYEVSKISPKKKSSKIITRLNHEGVIINDGNSKITADQLNLDFTEVGNILQITEGTKENGQSKFPN